MAGDTGPQCKQCRREGQKLFLKGSRCFTDKCGVERRSYPPGEHGRGRQRQSEYRVQRAEKGWATAKARQAGKSAAEAAIGGGTDADAGTAPRLDSAPPASRGSSGSAVPQVFQTQRIPEGAPR